MSKISYFPPNLQLSDFIIHSSFQDWLAGYVIQSLVKVKEFLF